jgi:hypothetical protein
LRVIADGTFFGIELGGILRVRALIASLKVEVVRVIVRTHRQVFDHTRAHIFHREKETLVVDREIESTQV